jgi:hypothetical protein
VVFANDSLGLYCGINNCHLGSLVGFMKQTALKTNPCNLCKSNWHTAMACPTKAQKQLKRTPLKKAGKKTKQWIKDRRVFLEETNQTHCVVGGVYLPPGRETVDHDLARSRGGKNDKKNLNKMCGFHNWDKASRTLKEYLPIGRRKPCIVNFNQGG